MSIGSHADVNLTHRMWGQNMKTVRIVCLLAIGMIFATTAQAQSRASTGTIHFVGQIVEGGCGAEVQRAQVEISCFRDGVNHFQRVALNSSDDVHSMRHIGKITQRSLAGHPELQEMTISYH